MNEAIVISVVCICLLFFLSMWVSHLHSEIISLRKSLEDLSLTCEFLRKDVDTAWDHLEELDSDTHFVCTCPDKSELPCYCSHESFSCDECVYAMDPADLPEDFV